MEINWDISNKCDLNCLHCGARKCISNESPLSDFEYKTIINNISTFTNSVTLLGGEPLLLKNINSIISDLNQNHISVNIISNGQSKFENYKDLLQMGIDTITISIDGYETENDTIRGAGTWKKAMNVLDALCNEKQHYSFQLGVNIVINKINCNSIVQLLELLFPKQLDFITISLVSYTGNAEQNKDILYLDSEKVLDILCTISQYVINCKKENIVDISTNNPLLDELLFLKTGYTVKSNSTCGALLNAAYINSNGVLFPCRDYSHSGIDMKKSNIEYSHILRHFSDFISLQEDFKAYIHNNSCIFSAHCNYCPLIQPSCNKECEILSAKLYALVDTYNWANASNSYYIEINNRYFGFYINSKEKVEYSQEGFHIHLALQKYTSIDEISIDTKISKELVRYFIIDELKEGRICKS